MQSAGTLQLVLVSCLLVIAGCFAPSLPLLALSLQRRDYMADTQGNAVVPTRMSGAGAPAAFTAAAPVLKKFYVLVKDPADANLDLDKDPFRIQSVKADAKFTLLYTELKSRVSSEERSDQQLHHLTDMPVAVEFADSCGEEGKTFFMPGNVTSLRLRERTFGQSGVGGSLWFAGIGLSILLALNRDTHVAGKRVLELGSGVGLTGMTCARAGAATTLSDFGQVTGTSATQVLLPAPSLSAAEILWQGAAGLSSGGLASRLSSNVPAAAVLFDTDHDKPEALNSEKQTNYGEALQRHKQEAIVEEEAGDEEDYSEFNLPVAGGVYGSGSGVGGEEEFASATAGRYQPKAVLQNLAYAMELNGLEDTCQLVHMDWHSSLHPSFVPQQQYDVVVGSDLIYYTTDAAALAATIITHTASTGIAYLMCQRGRTGLVDLLRFLRAKGEVEEEEYTLVELVNKDAQPPPLVLVTYRPSNLATDMALLAEDGC